MELFQRNELRVERRGRGLKRGKWRSRGEQSMAKDKERMAEAGELEQEKKRIHHCSCVLIAVKSGTRLKGVMRR